MDIRLYSITLLCLLFIRCGGLRVDSGSSFTQEERRIDSLIQTYYAKNVFNGNVIVGLGDSQIFKKSYGYIDGSRSELLTDSSVFSIGSISKEFQAIGIMKLIEEGGIKPDTKLSAFFPDFPSWADSISMIHLVNNASGLPQLNFKTVKGENDLISDLRNTSNLITSPGTEYLYNHNIPILLKLIIEKTSGYSFQDYVKQTFWDNLAMNETVFDPEDNHPNLTRSFNASFENDKPYNPFKGWVYTTSNDLMKWHRATHDGSLVSHDSYKSLIQNEFFPDRQAALGDRELTEMGQTIHHWGGFFNYVSLTYVNFDKELYIVLLSNNGCRELLNMSRQIDGLVKDL